MDVKLFLALLNISAGLCKVAQPPQRKEPATFEDLPDWTQRGRDDLERALNQFSQWKPARNIVYFVGDGMGISTLTAARFFKSQYVTEGISIVDTALSWENFPATGLLKTYSTNWQVPDSAATATAFLCGEKAQSGTVGVNQLVNKGDCLNSVNNTLKSLLHYAQDEGKWAGLATTSLITDATGAVAYAHSPDRTWMSDQDIPAEHRDMCWDIARQLVDVDENQKIRVILGGGRRQFTPTSFSDEETGQLGSREDGRFLAQDWLAQKTSTGVPDTAVHYVEKKSQFDVIDPDTEQYLMGLFDYGEMSYESDRRLETGEWQEPSLAEMTEKAIRVLQKAPEGYFLLVEGGKIDSAHHANNAYRALMDVVALDDAVQTALDLVDLDDTLIVVTADHSHLFNIAGDPALDNDILGVSVMSDGSIQMALDDKPFTTLSYTNGPGFIDHRTKNGSMDDVIPRINLTNVDTSAMDFKQDSSVPRSSATHAGEDVAVYARGPMAHLLSGQHEQSYIPHAIKYAACLGENKEMCLDPRPYPGCSTSASNVLHCVQWLLWIHVLVLQHALVSSDF